MPLPEATPGVPKTANKLPFIPDKNVFRAVMFALKMIEEGIPPQDAYIRSGKYYNADRGEIAKYCNQARGIGQYKL
jgi:hypothetical protein